MAAAPYWLFAAGIVGLILGAIVASLRRPPDTYIDARMSDKEVSKRLERAQQGDLLSSLIVFVSGVSMTVGCIWIIVRIVRRYL
jgi:hypothetical protein